MLSLKKVNLDRFLYAQQQTYTVALKEIKAGRKTSHWMWFIFPQLSGLGYSEMAKRYAISSLIEAEAYLAHPILGQRLIEISNAVLHSKTNNPTQLLGNPDDLKLCSCMTLFSQVKNPDPVFEYILDKFFNGNKDQQTLAILAIDLSGMQE